MNKNENTLVNLAFLVSNSTVQEWEEQVQKFFAEIERRHSCSELSQPFKEQIRVLLMMAKCIQSLKIDKRHERLPIDVMVWAYKNAPGGNDSICKNCGSLFFYIDDDGQERCNLCDALHGKREGS